MTRRDDLDAARGIIHSALIGLAFWLTVLLLVVLLAGCEHVTPYVAVDHMSDPREQDDGYTWGCAGIKTRHQLSVTGGYCWDIQGTHWNVAELRIEYDLWPAHN